MTSLAALTIDELADGICLRAGRIAAAQAELLRWIGEFDRREGWAGNGMLSCAHWLSWRAGTALGTARDQVRVARRLEELPEVAAAFADGRVSYSKVRECTRVAGLIDEEILLKRARDFTAEQLERAVRGFKAGRTDRLVAEQRRGFTHRVLPDGGVQLTAVLAPEEAAAVLEVAPGTVKSRCSRGRSRLAPLLADLRADGNPDPVRRVPSRAGTPVPPPGRGGPAPPG